jgi:hypothetical protein
MTRTHYAGRNKFIAGRNSPIAKKGFKIAHPQDVLRTNVLDNEAFAWTES